MPQRQNSRECLIRQAMGDYESSLIRYAFRLTGQIESAREVVQDTFLRLCEADAKVTGNHLAPWLFTVCRNRALDAKRKDKRMLRDCNNSSCESADSAPDPAQQAVAEEGYSQVKRALARLPANQQEVLRLRFQSELSYKEIAEVTSLSVTNVGYLIHKAIRAVREQLSA